MSAAIARRGIASASRWLTGVGASALVVMTLWTVVDVLTRYALSKPLAGSIDLVECTLVLVVFLALPACFLRGEEITVDVVDHILPQRVVHCLQISGTVATLVFVLLLGLTGIQPMVDAWQFGDRKPELPVPIFALLAVIETSIASAAIVLAGKLHQQVRRVSARELP